MGFDDKLVNMIQFVDNTNNCSAEYKKQAQVLDVIKTACNPYSLLSDSSAKKALKKAISYNLETDFLNKAIETLQNRLLEH